MGLWACGAAGVLVLALLSGCIHGVGGETTGKAEPSMMVPTAPPAAASVRLGPTGPSTAGGCEGIEIPVDVDPQEVIDAHPGGTTFCFTKGVHRIARPIRPTEGSTLASGAGAVLSGAIELRGWAPDRGLWVLRGALPAAYKRKGQCEDLTTRPCQLGEQVFVDGRQLRRVM